MISLTYFRTTLDGAGGSRELHLVSPGEDGKIRYFRNPVSGASECREISYRQIRCVVCGLLGRASGRSRIDIDIGAVSRTGKGVYVWYYSATSTDSGGVRLSILDVVSGWSESSEVNPERLVCFFSLLFDRTDAVPTKLGELLGPCPEICRPDCTGLPWLPKR